MNSIIRQVNLLIYWSLYLGVTVIFLNIFNCAAEAIYIFILALSLTFNTFFYGKTGLIE